MPHQQRKTFLFIAGLMILLFSLGFFSFRLEFSLKKQGSYQEKYKILQVKHEALKTQSMQERQKIHDLSRKVDNLANNISSLIYQGNALNDSLNHWFSQGPEVVLRLQDSLQIIQTDLEQNEHQIDSLNQLFTEKSDVLLEKMENLNKQDLKLKLEQVHLNLYEKSILFIKMLLFIYVFFLSGGVLWGIILLTKSFSEK